MKSRGGGYAGGYTLVKDFLRPLRAAGKVQAVLRFETEPGVQARVDWAHFGTIDLDGRRHRLYLFSLVLGYSRARYVEFSVRTDTATFVQCHLNAFAAFGGWTQEILYDNTRNVVLEQALKVGDSAWNPLFEDFHRHFGFAARLCRPRRAQMKGKVENVVKDTRYGFFLGRTFASLADLNLQAGQYGRQTFERVHRTTGVAPSARFPEERLTPLASPAATAMRSGYLPP